VARAHPDPEAVALRAERDALLERVDRLERAEHEQRDLLACIVHDLKNPLSVVASSLDLMREQLGEGAGLVGEALEEANQATHRLRLMIDDLLTMARLQHSAPPLHREAIDLGALLRDVTREYLRAAEDRQIELLSPPGLPVQVTTDRALLLRALQKIVEASLRHTPTRGRVSVAMRAARDVEITVAHTGAPIPVADRPQFFDRLAKVEGPGRARRSGVGLYLSNQAVHALGGAIEIIETPEWPTAFVVHIPAA
jgi:signal transduction histidine kinase